MNLRSIPLERVHKELGAQMIPYAGYVMPIRYSSERNEHHIVRKGVGIFDVSHMGEFRITGSAALDFIQYTTSNDASKLKIGQAQYSCLPNESGGIVDDILVYRLADQEYMWVVNASNIEKDWNWIHKFKSQAVSLENISDQTCLFSVQGPTSYAVLKKLTSVALSSIPYYHFVRGELAGCRDVIISRTGYTGAGGYELYVPKSWAESVWQAILEAGASESIAPVGLSARDTLRLEMGYCLYGQDIDDTTSPIEAGLGWITKFTKDFVNSDYLKKQKEGNVLKRRVGFQLIEKRIPRSGYELFSTSGEKIGRVTSGTLSPTLDLGIGMGYVKTPYTKPETIIYVDIRGKMFEAKVCSFPFVHNAV